MMNAPAILTESPEKLASFQQIARKLIAAWAQRCVYYMSSKMDRWVGKREDLWLLPAVSLDEAFPNRRKGLHSLDPDIQKFIRNVRHLAVEAHPRHSRFKGQIYHRWNEIRIYLYFSDEHYQHLDWLRQNKGFFTYYDWMNFLNHRFVTLVHELDHAYVEWASEGKWTDNARSEKANKSKIEAWGSSDEELKQQAHADYLNDPIEISARFHHTITELGQRVHQPWKDYLWQFQSNFEGWRDLSKAEQRRLTIRLAQYWMHEQRPKRRNIAEDVKQLQAKLRQKYGLPLLFIHYNENRDFVSIDSFDTDDANTRMAILSAVMRFADIRRQQVSVQDMPFSPYAKKLGFVKQQSRHKDYALPLGTTMYRPAREKRIGGV